MKSLFSCLVPLTVLASILSLTGCTSLTSTPETVELKPIRSIAVLPCEASLLDDRSANKEKAAALASGAQIVTTIIGENLVAYKGIRIVSEAETEGLSTKVYRDKITSAMATAKQMGCDAALMGTVYRFSERKGRDYSASQPASVDFELQLIVADSGAVLWSGRFDETQESLFENLLNFNLAAEREFKWITAEDLTREGVKKELDSCPYLQKLR